MTSKLYLLFFLFIGLSACQENKEKKLIKEHLSKKENVISIDAPLTLNKETSKSVSKWKEYGDFKQYFDQFLKTTSSEALNNADELNTLAKQLKDSIRIPAFKIPAFKARLNVLQNETMRLKDMTTIPNLTENDVKNQLIKILNALDATNAKLNSMILQQQVEEDISGVKFLKDRINPPRKFLKE